MYHLTLAANSNSLEKKYCIRFEPKDSAGIQWKTDDWQILIQPETLQEISIDERDHEWEAQFNLSE